ncbi:MAG: hypothetical protein ACYCYE_01860 [Clostridia bacterium]
MAFKKECVLTDRECNDCGECDICDLNPDKICDNCCVCIEKGADFNSIEIDEIIEGDDIAEELDDLGVLKYEDDYIVDYSAVEPAEESGPASRNIKRSDN